MSAACSRASASSVQVTLGVSGWVYSRPVGRRVTTTYTRAGTVAGRSNGLARAGGVSASSSASTTIHTGEAAWPAASRRTRPRKVGSSPARAGSRS